ncbi:hypothetical protein Droror1_Dr00009037 [Drosera rotundifolia]
MFSSLADDDAPFSASFGRDLLVRRRRVTSSRSLRKQGISTQTKSGLSNELSSFNLDYVTKDKMLAKLEEYARGVVESKAKEEAGRVLFRMKDKRLASAATIGCHLHGLSL